MNVHYNEAFMKVANTVKIEVLEAGFADLDKSWNNQDVCSPYSRLYYVISGQGYLRLRGENHDKKDIHVLRPGFLYLIPNGLSYDYFCEDKLEKVYVHINVSLQNSLELFSGCHDYYETPIDAELLANMKHWMTSRSPEDYFYLKGEIYRAVALFTQMAGIGEKIDRRYSHMVTLLFDLLPKTKMAVSIREMAGILNVSESTLAKHFKRETGMSIGDYRAQLVMNRARQLLAMGKLNAREIAEELGFGDQFYFSKYFKQRQGITPSAYKSHYVSGSRLPHSIPTTEPATG